MTWATASFSAPLGTMKSTLTGSAGFLQVRLGFCDIALLNREHLLVVGMLRADPLIAGSKLAVEHHLVERLSIDREIERLAHLLRLAERTLVLVVAGVDDEAEIAELQCGGQLEPGIGAHVLDVGRQHPFD